MPLTTLTYSTRVSLSDPEQPTAAWPVASISLADLETYGTVNEATLTQFDVGFDPGTIQVFYNERDGLRNLIFPEPRDRDTSYFMRRGDITLNRNDRIYRIKLEENI